MLQFNMTYHARAERLDRLALCVEKFGVGDFIIEHHNINDHTICKLSDTGLMLILNENNKLITGFMATVTQVQTIYKNNEKIPPSWLLRTAHNNQTKMSKYKG